MDIFSFREEEEISRHSPLALRLRPRSLDGFVGQRHLVGEGKPLRRLVENDLLSSLLFYGPPGTGKTTLAEIIAASTSAHFSLVNAVSSSIAELRRIILEARQRLGREGKRTVLFIDEIHRFNKAQQDALLPAVEAGVVALIGATTENPYFTVNAPLLSRMRIFPFEPLAPEDIRQLLDRALACSESGLAGVTLTEDAAATLAALAGGDARVALNALELAAAIAPAADSGSRVVDKAAVEMAVQKSAVVYDRDGDSHFDTISAFIKSVRGSDPDAAIYWLARMLEAGEDPLFIARRLTILASEDIGNADPHGLLVAVAAAQAVHMIGMPEARITLAQATAYLACAPKSNSSYLAVEEAMKTVKQRPGDCVPVHLRDSSYSGAANLGHGKDYLYPHDFPGNYVAQDYLPAGLATVRFYRPTGNGYERTIRDRLDCWKGNRRGKNGGK